MFLGWGGSKGAYQLSRVAPAVERAERMKVIMVGALDSEVGAVVSHRRWLHPAGPSTRFWAAMADHHPMDGTTSRPSAPARSLPAICARPIVRGMTASAPAVVLFLLCAAISAVEVPAEVVSVTDGDTIAVTVAGREERVRLLYIDTPESKSNAHGEASREGKLAVEFLGLQAMPGSAVTLWALAMSWSATATSGCWRS